jgi:replicative DNA helicase
MSEDEERAAMRVLEKTDGWKLHIDDSPALPVSQILARSRRLQNSHGLDMVVIDHLNYIGSDGKSENRTNEVRKITAALKGMSKELNIPVICLCQLSRALESRPNKKPILADLRESGTIEQDADIVMFLYREAYYSKDAGDKSANLEVAKIRDGLLGDVAMRFDGVHQRFTQDAFAGAYGKSLMTEDIPL